jgi:hypothetical protein
MMVTAAASSATTLTAPAGTIYTGEIKAESEGHAIIDNPIAKIECSWSFGGTVQSHGSGATVRIALSSLATTGCTNSWHFTTVAAGRLEVHWTNEGNGTLTWTESTTESTRFGITCRYSTSNTDFGTITGRAPATLDISAAIPFHSGSGLCGSSAVAFTGSVNVTTPGQLLVDA